MDTPKPGWSGAEILGPLSEVLGVPAGIQTDVEAAAVAEQALGPEPRPRQLAYVTVGTGIGRRSGGGRRSLAGDATTASWDTSRVRRVERDDYPGRCPFHNDCLEGMASGPAIAERWDLDPSDADGRNDIWQLEAAYLAQLVRVLAYSFAPDRVVFGGGVGSRPGLAEMIRAESLTGLGGYADYTAGSDAFVSSPALGDDSGLLGAALLARSLLED